MQKSAKTYLAYFDCFTFLKKQTKLEKRNITSSAKGNTYYAEFFLANNSK